MRICCQTTDRFLQSFLSFSVTVYPVAEKSAIWNSQIHCKKTTRKNHLTDYLDSPFPFSPKSSTIILFLTAF